MVGGCLNKDWDINELILSAFSRFLRLVFFFLIESRSTLLIIFHRQILYTQISKQISRIPVKNSVGHSRHNVTFYIFSEVLIHIA